MTEKIISGFAPKLLIDFIPQWLRRPEGFYCNEESRRDNPVLMVAEQLQHIGLPLTISDDARDRDGRPVEGLVAIIIPSEEVRTLYWQITSTPEIRALSLATSVLLGPPNVSRCLSWDEETQQRIKALYWRNKSAVHRNRAKKNYIKGGPIYNMLLSASKEAGAMAREALPEGTRFPTVRDLRELVNSVVGRELLRALP